MYFDETTSEPPFERWDSIIKENTLIQQERGNLRLPVDLQSIRSEMLDLASQYSLYLNQIAEGIGHESSHPGQLKKLSLSPIVMCGHQPIIYHSGIIYKNFLLDQICKNHNTYGVNIIIDTDTGDGFKLNFPSGPEHLLRINTLSLGDPEKPFFLQKLPSAAEIRDAFTSIHQALQGLGFHQKASQSIKAGEIYQKLEGLNITVANTVVRRIFEESPIYFDLPLSLLLDNKNCQYFFSSLISDYKNLANTYNSLLDSFREKRRIKNSANPFPNLKIQSGKVEMPFWIVNVTTQERAPLWVLPDGDFIKILSGEIELCRMPADNTQNIFELLPGHLKVVPRALVTTVLLRLLLSDMFIHGIGGAKYDEFTDIFISKYFGVQAPKFVMASASSYLFNEKRLHLKKLSEEKLLKREMYFHIERHLDHPDFTKGTRSLIENLIGRKKDLIEQIKIGKSKGDSTAVYTQEIKKIESDIRKFVDSIFAKKEGELVSPNLEDLYSFRELPFFLF